MAEPQTNPATEQARGKSDASPRSATETRSFETADLKARPGYGETPPPGAQQSIAQRPAEFGRQLAESWRAMDPLLNMQYDFGRWFDEVWRQTFGFQPMRTQPFGALGRFGAAGLFGLPPADLKETSQAHLLAIELPGLARSDLNVSIDGDTLVISGHKAEETDGAAGARYHFSERRFGHFERIFPLPADVDRSKIEAKFQDGVLNVTLPREAATSARRSSIPIKG
ncbi:MAG TPA: Hsp20/alpha crystallin family protein [Caulobacteraceae bacterium]|nr:Hsp20/alpha crystallin family protein [Caulobacteraceae bacterium]